MIYLCNIGQSISTSLCIIASLQLCPTLSWDIQRSCVSLKYFLLRDLLRRFSYSNRVCIHGCSQGVSDINNFVRAGKAPAPQYLFTPLINFRSDVLYLQLNYLLFACWLFIWIRIPHKYILYISITMDLQVYSNFNTRQWILNYIKY